MTRRSDAKTGGAPVAAPGDAGVILDRLAAVLESRKGGDPERSYVARLLSRGPDAILKKIGEEATETVMAAKDGAPERIVAETADLWFHCLVMLAHFRVVAAPGARRTGPPGGPVRTGREGREEVRFQGDA